MTVMPEPAADAGAARQKEEAALAAEASLAALFSEAKTLRVTPMYREMVAAVAPHFLALPPAICAAAPDGASGATLEKFDPAACAAYLAHSGHTDPAYWRALPAPERAAWREAVAAAAPYLHPPGAS